MSTTMRRLPKIKVSLALSLLSLFNVDATWTPRDRFWRHIQEDQAGLLGEDDDGLVDHFQDIRMCLRNKLSVETKRLLKEETEVQPIIVDSLTDTQNRTILVEIGNAISPHQAQAVKDLAACTREFFPTTRFEQRDFAGSGGGNACTFINILLQIFLPQVASNLQRIAEMAYDTAAWGGERLNLPRPGSCGLRTSEYLDYGKFRYVCFLL